MKEKAFYFKNNQLFCEQIPLQKVAERYGTPTYVYSFQSMKNRASRFVKAFEKPATKICFAVKANSNLSILKIFHSHGIGADTVSIGEIRRSLLAGCLPENIVFSGVGKREDELRAAIDLNLFSLNCESVFELQMISELCRLMKKRVRISLRLNLDIQSKTHHKIATGAADTKFGINEDDLAICLAIVKANPWLELSGLACHIGSQMLDLGPLRRAALRLSTMSLKVMQQGYSLKTINVGGGLGIRYENKEPPSIEDYAATLLKSVKSSGLQLVIEPGRALIGEAGVLLSQVIGVKAAPKKSFVVIDAGMNDLIRPALYDAYHEIFAVKSSHLTPSRNKTPRTGKRTYEVVGPVCETGDIFGKKRSFTSICAGEWIAIMNAGAYGSSMASTYNSRPRPAELLIDGSQITVVRTRESLEDLWSKELLALSQLKG